ncbi:MAG: hypothetical protein OXC68_11740 [Aestuariivita sp.]|nr:hypothetical protein [Aestuariivita sp.]
MILKKPSWRPLLFSVVLPISLLISVLPALPCTENAVLDLIGQLEAPTGYDTVYRGVRVPPPQPITTMTVGQVLDWQGHTVRAGSVSTAAGRYQIIRATLQRLVTDGVVGANEPFDAVTQDRLGRHLLRETGYRDGDTSVATANRIAQVWAALPDLSTGQSAYEGIAGNHALLTASRWQAVLNCSIRPDDPRLLAELATIRMGERFGFTWDRMLEDMARSADQVMRTIGTFAIGLLLGLFVIDLILRGGQGLLDGRLSTMMTRLIGRFLVVLLCLAVLQFPGQLLDMLTRFAFRIAGTVGAGDFALSTFAADRMVLVFSLMEGLMAYPSMIRTAVQSLALLVIGTAAVQIAALIYWMINLVLVGASGVFALGFGGLKETTSVARAYIRHMIGATFALLTALILVAATAPVSWQIHAAGTEPLPALLSILLVEGVATALLWALPAAVAAVASGPGQTHPNPFRAITPKRGTHLFKNVPTKSL